MKNLKFIKIIDALKEGKRVKRQDWKGEFIYMQIPSEIPIEVVPNMQSLPQLVKDEFVRRNNDHEGQRAGTIDPILFNTIRYKNQLAMVYPDNTIMSWTPSNSDVLQNVWEILD